MRLRESLEPQVSAMAQAAKKLFEENVKYSDGTPVKVVIANHSIGRVPESAACAEQFKKENVAVTLSVTPCWCYGAEIMDMAPATIKAVWGFNGTERPGRYISPAFWLLTRKRDCPHSVYTAEEFKTGTT